MGYPTINVDSAVASATSTTHTIGAATTSTSGAPIYVILLLNDGWLNSEVTPASGFSHVVTYGGGTGAGDTRPTIQVWVKTSGGSESGNYTFTVDGSVFGYIQSFWLSGSDEADPLPTAHRAGANSASADVSTIDAPSVTTGRDQCTVYRGGFVRVSGANPSITTPSTTNLHSGSRAVSGHHQAATAGATGAATIDASVAGRAVAVTLAFQGPAASGTQALRRFILNIT